MRQLRHGDANGAPEVGSRGRVIAPDARIALLLSGTSGELAPDDITVTGADGAIEAALFPDLNATDSPYRSYGVLIDPETAFAPGEYIVSLALDEYDEYDEFGEPIPGSLRMVID